MSPWPNGYVKDGQVKATQFPSRWSIVSFASWHKKHLLGSPNPASWGCACWGWSLKQLSTQNSHFHRTTHFQIALERRMLPLHWLKVGLPIERSLPILPSILFILFVKFYLCKENGRAPPALGYGEILTNKDEDIPTSYTQAPSYQVSKTLKNLLCLVTIYYC